jgi:hypothetical protein
MKQLAEIFAAKREHRWDRGPEISDLRSGVPESGHSSLPVDS